jgi:putative phosphoesterase
MKLAILSDIHDNVWNLHAAMHWLLSLADDEAIDGVICCGDLCSPFVMVILIDYCKKRWLPIHLVFGNNDGDGPRITAQAQDYSALTIHYEMAELVEFDGKLLTRQEFEKTHGEGSYLKGDPGDKRIAFQHYDNLALPIIASNQYDVVFFGHNHQHEVRRDTRTLALNPGTLLGYKPRGAQDVEPTFALYDTNALVGAEYHFFQVKNRWQSPKKPGKVAPFKVKETTTTSDSRKR